MSRENLKTMIMQNFFFFLGGGGKRAVLWDCANSEFIIIFLSKQVSTSIPVKQVSTTKSLGLLNNKN